MYFSAEILVYNRGYNLGGLGWFEYYKKSDGKLFTFPSSY